MGRQNHLLPAQSHSGQIPRVAAHEGERVPFTLVCDFRADCFDGSDEDFCIHPPCVGNKAMPCGDSGQCIRESDWCSLFDANCKNNVDITLCDYVTRAHPRHNCYKTWLKIYRLPAIVEYNSESLQTGADYRYMQPHSEIPSTHFQCPSVPYIFPVFVRCNGIYDCPYKEDELSCESYSCPGLFRCRQSRVCLHPDHVCDGRNHCPQLDDEWHCALDCPRRCSCQGLAFTCTERFPVERFPEVRYLDLSGSAVKAEDLFMNKMLVYLNFTGCGLTDLLLPELPNVKILDVGYNQLRTVCLETLKNVSNLNHLVLTSNPLTSLFPGELSGDSTFPGELSEDSTFPELRILDLSLVEMQTLNLHRLGAFPGLVVLNLSGSRTQVMSGAGFHNLGLARLDLRGNQVAEFPRGLFQQLNQLTELHVDSYKLCCQQTLPLSFNPRSCHNHGAPPLLSTCDRLLGAKSQQVVIYILTSLILLGNGAVLFSLARDTKNKKEDSTQMMVSHLCGSKLLMGVYLSVLCGTDQVLKDRYLWVDRWWRSGPWCQALAWVFLLSCEVSVLLDVALTVERCVTLTWPDRDAREEEERKRKRRKVVCVCLSAWLIGLCLSMFPAVSSDSEFSQTSLYVPLPVSGDHPGSHPYAFLLLLLVNGPCMLLSVAGQAYISFLIRHKALDTLLLIRQDHHQAQPFHAARRVISVVIIDACCWGLVTSCAMLTSAGILVEGDALFSTSMSLVVVYVSAALTPWVFVGSGVVERRREGQRQRVLTRLRGRLKSQSK